MKKAQNTAKTLTINTTLFDMLAAMQEDAIDTEINSHHTDTQIVSKVAEWMQSGRISSYNADPIRSAA